MEITKEKLGEALVGRLIRITNMWDEWGQFGKVFKIRGCVDNKWYVVHTDKGRELSYTRKEFKLMD